MEHVSRISTGLVGQFKFENSNQSCCLRCRSEYHFTKFYDPRTLERVESWTPCGCEVLDYMQERQQEAKAKKMQRHLKTFNENSLVNEKIKDATFSNFITTDESFREVARSVRRYVSEWLPGNVLLYGSYGTGKSHLAISATKLAINNGHTALFISVPKLFSKIKETYNRDSKITEDGLIGLINSVELLVLDDIGAESGREAWCQDKLFLILDGRQGKRTIYTTNLDAEMLEEKIGGRNYDRMVDDLKRYSMVGASHRRKDKITW